ncbi:MarC family integral membrane protein [uncultured archaeon]|nr:MarC family integral membrane protein [uncultured archaeon]
MDFALPSIITAFVALFIVMDPFSSVPVFITLTKKYTQEKKNEAALVATVVAAGVSLGFLFAGPYLLNVMGIRMESFSIAGGVLMFMIAVSFALGIDFGKKETDTPVEAVIIGVPLLAGPGVMLSVMLLSTSLGIGNVIIAAVAACTASYIILRLSSLIQRVIGQNGLEILSRVMGVLLAAFAMEYIRKGFGL